VCTEHIIMILAWRREEPNCIHETNACAYLMAMSAIFSNI